MVTLYLHEQEAKMVKAMLENTISDYTLKDLASHKYGDMLVEMRKIVTKVEAAIKRG